MEIAVDLVTNLAEKLRTDAKRLEDEKEHITSTIKNLLELLNSNQMSSLSPAQRDDAVCNLTRAYRLSETVQVSIKSMERDPAQVVANREVYRLLDELEKEVRRNPFCAKQRVVSYMNACCSNQVAGSAGPDEQFGAAILGCSLDDQKAAKKRIECMLDFIERAS